MSVVVDSARSIFIHAYMRVSPKVIRPKKKKLYVHQQHGQTSRDANWIVAYHRRHACESIYSRAMNLHYTENRFRLELCVGLDVAADIEWIRATGCYCRCCCCCCCNFIVKVCYMASFICEWQWALSVKAFVNCRLFVLCYFIIHMRHIIHIQNAINI